MKTYRCRKQARSSTRRLSPLRKQHGGDLDRDLYLAVSRNGDLEKVKNLIAAGANINHSRRKIPLLVSACYKFIEDPNDIRYFNIIKTLLENGANPNVCAQPCIHILVSNPVESDDTKMQNMIRMLNLFFAHGADPNIKSEPHNNTALNIAILKRRFDYIRVLLENGADPSIKDGFGVDAFRAAAIYSKNSPKVLELLKTVKPILGTLKLWEGWSRADVAFLNNVFTEEKRDTNATHIPRALDFSLCPVCLKTIERPSGCMYMKHNCTTQDGFYHKALYEKYKGADENIHWCTICNRIGKDHQHYNLGLAQGPIPMIIAYSYPFDIDCSTRSGGGGLPEKYQRFNRLRNVALRFNHPAFIDKKSQREVLEKLVEAMWDAPFVQDPLTEIQWSEKQWNRPNTNFPLPKPSHVKTNRNTNTNIPVPEGVQDPLIHPVETDEFVNATFVDDKDILQFRHTDNAGVLRLHDKPGQQISRVAFASWLSDLLGNPTEERFGHCWQYSETDYGSYRCTAKLYPKEVRLALGLTEEPTEGENAQYRQLYKNYRMLFNRKERGGN
jgi:hypothetical protein